MSTLTDIKALIENDRYEDAQVQLRAISPESQEARSEAAYCRGRIFEGTGRAVPAIEAYQDAVEGDPQNLEATFRLAYLLDLHGEDEEALALYECCVAQPPFAVNALLNLATIYEDEGDFDAASRCLRLILREHPNHARARLFLKDVESSKTMYYDEEQERVREKHSAVLDMPIADFELSVRSRNCLKQMNINTLGDLLRVTEPQLMVYKNFGETSLSEIKVMLTQKGLRLGQMVEQSAVSSPGTTALSSLGTTGVYARPVSELELSVRARKCLQRLGISTLGELAARTEGELLAIKNFGQTSLNEIKRRLAEVGLALRG